MNTIRTIIFDFDGTLADTGAAVKQAFWGTLNELNVSLSKPISFNKLSCLTLEEMFRSVGIGDFHRLRAAQRIYQDYYRNISSRKAKLFPGVPETLARLREMGFELAIATNENRQNLDHLLALTGISTFFSKTVCENEVENTKPDPEMARTIMSQLNASPDQTLMVGDSILDMQMGKSVGAYTCGVTYGAYSAKSLASRGADWIIWNFEELPALVNGPALNRNANYRQPQWNRETPQEQKQSYI